MGLMQLGIFEIILFNIPSILVVMILSITVQKYESLKETENKLGLRIGNISKKSSRLFIIVPTYLLYVSVSIMMLVINNYKYLIINIVILTVSIITALVFEKRIFNRIQKWGLYENGLYYKKGCVLFSKIPEIEIIDNTKIEILNDSGMREIIKLNQENMGYIENTIMHNKKKVINNDWNKNT
jgi:ABC-type siderophore export system fused ATPase/permease subunit